MQIFTDNKQKTPQDVKLEGFINTYNQWASPWSRMSHLRQHPVKVLLHSEDKVGFSTPYWRAFRTGVYSYPVNQKQAYSYIIVVEPWSQYQ